MNSLPLREVLILKRDVIKERFENERTSFKEAKSATMNIFREKIFSFQIVCKSRIELSFYNKSVHYS